MSIDPQDIVIQAYQNDHAYPLVKRIQMESGRSLSDLSLQCDARVLRAGTPLNRLIAYYLGGPPHMRGNRLLVVENKPFRYDSWFYVRRQRRVRRYPFRGADPISGTGLLNEDLLSPVGNWRPRLLDELDFAGFPAARIELRPGTGVESAYERIVGTFWIPKPTQLMAEFYRDGEKIKTLKADLDTAATVEGRDYFQIMTIEEFIPRPRLTVITTTDFDPLDKVEEKVFAPTMLRVVSRLHELDLPAWGVQDHA